MLVSRRIFLALGAVWLSLSVLEVSPALAGPTVTVRVEGESSTLLPLTSVKLESPEPVSGCPASSATAAINLAVNGDWDHGDEDGSKGDFTETILGETHIFEDNGTTWDVWVNDRWGGGICEDLLNEGEEVLLVADHLGANFAPERLPLVLSGAPTTVDAGTSFTVDVNKIFLAHGGEKVGEGEPKPEEGVTVSGGGASATTGADGAATLTLTNTGPVTLRATKAGDAPSASIVVCVHNGNDGTCGTTAPTTSSASTSTSGATTPATGVAGFAKSAPYTGPYALVARATDLIEDHTYGPTNAPRVLSGTVLAHSAVSSISLQLRRKYKGRCSAYNGTHERFVPVRCGKGSYFKVSTSASYSYLLPAALAPGRYVLDIRATDASGNHTTLARGSSRIVFYVR